MSVEPVDCRSKESLALSLDAIIEVLNRHGASGMQMGVLCQWLDGQLSAAECSDAGFAALRQLKAIMTAHGAPEVMLTNEACTWLDGRLTQLEQHDEPQPAGSWHEQSRWEVGLELGLTEQLERHVQCYHAVIKEHGGERGTLAEQCSWLDARLSLLEEHEAILKEAALPASGLYSSPQQPERSGFAAKLRAAQALSASQAMILMATKLQNAMEENERLRQELEWQQEAQRALLALAVENKELRAAPEGKP